MTAPIYGVMEYLNGPIVAWRIDCPIHGRVSSADVRVRVVAARLCNCHWTNKTAHIIGSPGCWFEHIEPLPSILAACPNARCAHGIIDHDGDGDGPYVCEIEGCDCRG